MCSLDLDREVDLVTCLGDALNHLLRVQDLEAAFASVRRALRPGGLYVFDLNTTSCFEQVVAATHVIEHEGVKVSQSGQLRPSTAGLMATVAFGRTDHDGRRSSRQVERYFSAEEVDTSLRRAGLVPLSRLGLTMDGVIHKLPDEAHHHKTIHVARRPPRRGGESPCASNRCRGV
jgi:hypothetical protein